MPRTVVTGAAHALDGPLYFDHTAASAMWTYCRRESRNFQCMRRSTNFLIGIERRLAAPGGIRMCAWFALAVHGLPVVSRHFVISDTSSYTYINPPSPHIPTFLLVSYEYLSHLLSTPDPEHRFDPTTSRLLQHCLLSLDTRPTEPNSPSSRSNMPTTSANTELDFDQWRLRDEHASNASPSFIHSHKRGDSTEFACTGALFPQKSWPRPPIIDIPIEEAVTRRIASSSITEEPESMTHPRPGLGRNALSSSSAHHYSTEEVQKLIQQLSATKSAGKNEDSESGSSSTSERHDSPAMSEDDKLSGTQTPRRLVEASNPSTPPPPSVATTEDDNRNVEAGPISPNPWSSFERKRKRTEDDVTNRS
ncbi:hypothetical protein EK21DRAFT_87797 [Setomelanomma holmii]|uniref:Uncharacterized protein n=1 Tax=Setomelanomma holmii TaxID=210430 RepID=A0A9P4HDN9_9PLEO|nr:hypothetical protein EK21DRAFT_87797 [Setomelanomma holmii]